MSQPQLKTRSENTLPTAAEAFSIVFKSRYEAEDLISAAIEDKNLVRQEVYILCAIDFLENISIKKCPYGTLRNALQAQDLVERKEKMLMCYTAIVRGL